MSYRPKPPRLRKPHIYRDGGKWHVCHHFGTLYERRRAAAFFAYQLNCMGTV